MKALLTPAATILGAAALTFASIPPATAAPARVRMVELPMAEGRTLSGVPDINDRGQVSGWTTSAETRRSRLVRWDPLPDGRYRRTPLTADRTGSSRVNRINDRGDVLGADGGDLVIWDRHGRKVAVVAPLSALSPGASDVMPPSINDRRQVLYGKGMGGLAGFPASAVLWSPSGQVEYKGPPGNYSLDHGDLNERGEVMGTLLSPDHKGFRWDGTTAIYFQGPDGTPAYWMIDLNDRGQAVGMTNGGSRAFVRHRGRSQDIGTLGGGGTYMHPVLGGGINDRGQVTGVSATADNELHPFIWHRGRMTDLGTLGGEATALYQATASDISDRGQVIGASMTAGGELHPYVWHRGRMHDLHVPGSDRTWPVVISDQGRIAGTVTTEAGARPVVWILR